MKALRVILAVLGGVLALAVIAAVYFVSQFDLNDYKDEITAAVQERTGRSLSIDRNIELSLFPWLAIETGGVSFGDDPAFGERSFIAVDALSARVRVWPLLRRRVEIGRVIVDGVDLNLGADADGRGNWESLIEAAESTAPLPSEPGSAPPDSAAPTIRALAIEAVELRNARILWHDADGEVRYQVRDLDLVSGPIDDDAPVELELAFSALDVASGLSIELELATIASLPERKLDDVEATIRLRDTDESERARASLSLSSIEQNDRQILSAAGAIELALTRPPVGPESLALRIAYTALELDTDSEQLVIDGLTAATGGIEARTNLSADRLLTAPRLSGDIELNADSLGELLALLGRALPASLADRVLGDISVAADFSLDAEPLAGTIEGISLSALGIDATGSATLAPDGALTAAVDIPAFAPSQPLRSLLGGFVPAGTDLSAIEQARAAARIGLSPDRRRLDVSEFTLALNSARVVGELRLTELGRAPSLRGAVTATGLDSRLLRALAESALPAELLETQIGQFQLATEFAYAAASQSATLDPLSVTAYGLSGQGRVAIDASGPALALAGQARLAEFSPRELLARFGLPAPESSDPSVLDSARLSADFETTGDSGYFRNIDVRLDDSTITGSFSVENFADPSYRFALGADRIDVDRYLPPRAADEPAAGASAAAAGATRASPAATGASGAGATDRGAGTTATAAATTTERKLGDMRLDAEALAATAITGSASVGALTLAGLQFEQLATDLAIGGGRAALSSVRTRLYGGSFDGSFAVDATGATGSIELEGQASELALKPLLDALIGDSSLSGTGNFELDLTGHGETLGQAIESAAGAMSVSFRDGQLAGFNIGRELCAVVNTLRGLPAPPAAADATAFSVIRASTTVSDGLATSSDIYATTGFLELTGRGSIRLVDQWLDTSFRAAMTGPVPLPGCERLNSRLDDPVPINFALTGQLPDVKPNIDATQLLEDLTRRELRQRVEDSVRDRLRGLLN